MNSSIGGFLVPLRGFGSIQNDGSKKEPGLGSEKSLSSESSFGALFDAREGPYYGI